MSNLSKQRRDKMIAALEELKSNSNEEHKKIILDIKNELLNKKYGLVWEEHQENVDLDLEERIPIFEEEEQKKIVSDKEGYYNFLLEGDNLHSLYLLEKTHKNKIDVIYIDPPYNTGNSFIYNDKVVGSEDEFRHSKWISAFKKRLDIASGLLKKEGIIFISINDYEEANVKLLCNEVFGENNFIGKLIWESTTQPTNAGKAKFSLQNKTETVFCYSRDKSSRKGFKLEVSDSEKKYPHKGIHGDCRFEIIEKSDAGAYNRESMKFEILGKLPRPGKRWQIGEETARQLEKEKKVEIIDGLVKKAVYPEDEENKISYIPFWSLLMADSVGTAQQGKSELNEILGRAAGFDTVKPVKLIKKLLGRFDNDITVLDYYAGSGTTAQAVLELNKEDNGSRSFILCTNNENNICEEITYPRIKTLITGYRGDNSIYDEPISANLKYYKTDWIDRKSKYLEDELSMRIFEMIELENHIQIDNEKYVVIMSEADAQKYLENKEISKRIEKVWYREDVLFTSNQVKKLKGIDAKSIPRNYFDAELKEGGYYA